MNKPAFIHSMLHSMTPFQWSEVLVMILLNVVYIFVAPEQRWWYVTVNSLSAICGVFCVVLCAAGKRSQYYWGFVNIAGYIVISYLNRLYGEVMLNALYYLPMQFIGLWTWKTHYNNQEEHVKCKKMSIGQLMLWIAASAICIYVYKLLLDTLQGNSTLLDSTSTVLSVFASLLMILRYREQWILWIVIDAVSVAMWIAARDFLMIIMWTIFLINAAYGFLNWTWALKKDRETAPRQ